MTKYVAKLLLEFKQEWKVDLRDLRECLERDLRKDMWEIKNTMSSMTRLM